MYHACDTKGFSMEYDKSLLNMFNACEQLCFLEGPGKKMAFKFPGTYALLSAYKNVLGNEFVGYNDEHNEEHVLPKMQKDVDFQERFHRHYNFLQRMIQKCSAENNPAENVLSDEEIRFILCIEPKYVNRVKKQSRSVQRLLVTLDETSLLLNPDGRLLTYDMTPEQISSVPFDSRDIIFEFYAVVNNKMLVKDTHMKQFPNVLIRELSGIEHPDRIRIVKQIEELGEPVFGKTDMEQMHISFVENDVFCYPGMVLNRYSAKQKYRARTPGLLKEKTLLAYIKNPTDAVKEKAIKHNPYVIHEISQDDAIQELALRVCAQKYDEVEENRAFGYPHNNDLKMYGNPWILSILYNQFLKNPSVDIEKLYETLASDRQRG